MTDNPLGRISQRWLEAVQEEVGQWVDNLIASYNPANLMSFIESMGMDLSQAAGRFSQEPGFDPYRVLGLDKTASDDEVKKRYRELLHRLHPDTGGVKGTTFLLQIVMASYELIKRERRWE